MMYSLHMKLSEYLKENKITQEDFLQQAKSVGATFSIHAVSKWCQGHRIPRQDEMYVIHAITNGAVSPNDFYILPNKIK
mgnify:FL=1